MNRVATQATFTPGSYIEFTRENLLCMRVSEAAWSSTWYRVRAASAALNLMSEPVMTVGRCALQDQEDGKTTQAQASSTPLAPTDSAFLEDHLSEVNLR